MVTQELFHAIIRERLLEVAQLQREKQARAAQEDGSLGRNAQPGWSRWLHLASFKSHALRGTPAP